MFNNITSRLILGFSVPILFLIILGSMLFSGTEHLVKLQSNSKEVGDNISSTDAYAYDVARIIASIRGYALYPKDPYYRGTYDKARESMLENKEELAKITDPQTREAVNAMIQIGDEYDSVSAGVFALVDADKMNEAKQQILIPRIARLAESSDRAHTILEAKLNDNLLQAQKAKQFQTLLIILGTLITIAATLATAFLIALPIRRDLPKVVKAAEQIAEGDLQQTIELSNDATEVGKLTTAFPLYVQKTQCPDSPDAKVRSADQHIFNSNRRRRERIRSHRCRATSFHQ
ncbi:MAG: hypothetical protein RSE13_23775 [Planktothrix sp. GU0601_MAG3]|nr:MAG: hypothetical protein RSE13_23775 [Planktothrix sp. GU0601_MAG3]